jgi:inner membrane protein
MDSLTQIALGSAVGYAVLGNKVGRKAAIYGAVLGTLPDLDVFIPFGGPVEDFTYHRSFSHSFIIQLLLSPIIAWLIVKLHPSTKTHFRGWAWLTFLTLSTHALLDGFTVYGTQFFWPISEYPFGFSTLFIIDPLYTLPLLVTFIACIIPRVSTNTRHQFSKYGLVISSIYLVWTIAAKWHIDKLNQEALAAKSIDSSTYMSTPAPFNTLLWRSVVVEDNRYFEIYTSVLDQPSDVSIQEYLSSTELLAELEENWGVQRLQWFTKGLYSIKLQGEKVILSDLRMGVEGSYIFSFEIGNKSHDTVTEGSYEKVSARPDVTTLPLFFERIFDPSVKLSPKVSSK